MNEFLLWCAGRSAECQARHKALLADHRRDEARFEQIRMNVYGVFSAVCKTLKDQPQALEKKLRDIPAAWESSLRLALEHGDEEKAHIERIKLETAAQILQEVPHDGK